VADVKERVVLRAEELKAGAASGNCFDARRVSNHCMLIFIML